MLTTQEQEEIAKKAFAMRNNEAMRQRKVQRNEMGTKRYIELRKRDEEDFRDHLKEVG